MAGALISDTLLIQGGVEQKPIVNRFKYDQVNTTLDSSFNVSSVIDYATGQYGIIHSSILAEARNQSPGVSTDDASSSVSLFDANIHTSGGWHVNQLEIEVCYFNSSANRTNFDNGHNTGYTTGTLA